MALTKRATLDGITVYTCLMADIIKLAQKPYKKQRCHELRVEKATHTHGKLENVSRHFAAASYRGQLILVDGYTRAEAYQRGLARAEGELILSVYTVANLGDALEKLYDQFDNRKATKRGKDHVAEGLRSGGFDVRSMSAGLLISGPLPSAMVSATGNTNTRRAAHKMVNAVKQLNRYSLDHNAVTVSAGVLAAFLAIAYYEPSEELAERFIRGIHASNYLPSTKAEGSIAAFHQFHQARKKSKTCSGSANVDSIRDTCLTMFIDYKNTRLNPRAKALRSTLSLGMFAELYNTKAA